MPFEEFIQHYEQQQKQKGRQTKTTDSELYLLGKSQRSQSPEVLSDDDDDAAKYDEFLYEKEKYQLAS